MRTSSGYLTPVVLWFLVLASAAVFGGDGQRQRSAADERLEAFEWFSTLEYPDVKDLKFVRVATGRSWGKDPEKQFNWYRHGFLLNERGNDFHVVYFNLDEDSYKPRPISSLKIELPSDKPVTKREPFPRKWHPLGESDYEKTQPGTPEHERVGYEVVDLPGYATELLKRYHKGKEKAADQEASVERRRFGERITERAEVFVLAWACWRNNHKDLAADLYARAERLNEERVASGIGERQPLKDAVAADLAHAEMWDAMLEFGYLGISRAQLLARFQRIVKHFPNSQHVARAKETAEILEKMVAEDAEHERRRKTGKPIAELPKNEQVAEWIFQLRDQNGRQWIQPGSCDIFGFFDIDNSGKTPAHQLAKLGLDAVPQLIGALDDKHFSRSVEYHRNFYFSHRVLTVGDCAEAIISRIAGRSFDPPRTNGDYMSRDERRAGVKKEVQAWYAELKAKGDK